MGARRVYRGLLLRRPALLAVQDGRDTDYQRYQAAIRYIPPHEYIPPDELKLQEDLRRYLCLRWAGFLEQLMFVIIHEFLYQKSSCPVQDFARCGFKHAPNLRYKVFFELVGRFGKPYADGFEKLLRGWRREALADLLEMRNDVAHGKTFKGRKLQPERYLRLCEDIYDWLIETFLGDSVEITDDDGYTRTGISAASR